MVNEFVLGIAIILLTGLLFGKLAKKFNIPNITGYLIGGLIIGPAIAKFIPHFGGILGWDLVKTLNVVIDIELGFIAFTVGSEFKIGYFKQVGVMPVIVAFAESLAAVLFITVGITAIGMAFGVPFYFALCLGAVGGATAPAATIMVIKQYKAKGELTQTLLSVVAIDDASALIFFGIAIAIVKTIVGSGGSAAMMVVWPFIEIIASVGLGLVTGVLLTIIIKVFKSNGNRLVLTVALIFVNIGICLMVNEHFGRSFSSLLACMAMGAVFTNTSDLVEDVMPLVESITPPLVVIFFVISGAGLEISAMGTWQAVVILILYLVFRVAGKVLGTAISAKACKAPAKVRKWLGFGLLPQGGIAIGLSLLVMQTLDGAPGVIAPYDGQMVRVIVMLAVFVSEIFGPSLSRYALIKSGEATASIPPKKRGKKSVALAAAGACGDDSGIGSGGGCDSGCGAGIDGAGNSSALYSGSAGESCDTASGGDTSKSSSQPPTE